MLDLGFERDIRKIVGATMAMPKRQTAMFSATWPDSVKKIASEMLHQPVQVTIGGESLSASSSVQQIVEVIDEHVRDRRLKTLLGKYHKSRSNRVLVFVLYKKEARRVEGMLGRNGWNVGSIHGDKSQSDRISALDAYVSHQWCEEFVRSSLMFGWTLLQVQGWKHPTFGGDGCCRPRTGHS